MTGPKSGRRHICRTFQHFQKRHDGSYRNQFFSRDFEGHREDFGQEKVVLDRGRSEHFHRALSPDGGLRCCIPAWLLGVQAKSEIHSGRDWPKSLPTSNQTSTRTMMISGNPIQSNLQD
jgi:predicted SAM-dependent methyltransferase